MAGGGLGSAIIKALKNEIDTDDIIGIARTPSKASYLGVEIRKADYNSKTEFIEALKGVNTLLIISGRDAPENRIGQHRNIIEAAKINDVGKLVYTSIVGDEKQSSFKQVVASNRQTEEDIRNSGLDWAIGRNGIYIEPDLECIEEYTKAGKIVNSAGEGRCGYTSRDELAYAYAKMLMEEKHNSATYNLVGEPVTQEYLAECINKHYNTQLHYTALSVEEYLQERTEALGEFLGVIISGIYESMSSGAFDVPSDFVKAAGRKHKSVDEMIVTYKRSFSG